MSSRDTRYRKITAELENRIRSGAYQPGSALPPRVELMAEFSVARATIDRCIGELRRRNLVVSRHGSGTFVKDELHHPYRIALVTRYSHELQKFPEAWEVTSFSANDLKYKSDWGKMLDCDGVIWWWPERKLHPVIDFLHDQIPQVIVNRTLPGEVCVSTDHRGAYYEITRERLDQLPESSVFLLQEEIVSEPTNYREEGFIDACRAAQRFYEIWPMPRTFEARLAKLEDLPLDSGKPLLLISTSFANTGAVMWFARKHQLEWKKDFFYSDFDNEISRDCWGVEVTSYIQNLDAMLEGAVAELEKLLEQEPVENRHTLIFPRRKDADT